MTRKSVQGGYCDYPDTVGCALTRFSCDDPANFRSSRQMQTAPAMAHGGSCRWQDSIRETVLGRCRTNGVDGGCASDLRSCPEGTSEWVYPSQECTVETTQFGRCDYGMCAWSHDHCHEDNTWEAFDAGCTCDNVRVGACSRWINNNAEREVYCAVSQEACDEEQSWITPHELKAAVGFDCYLCREETSGTSSNSGTSTTTGNNNVEMESGGMALAEDADYIIVGDPDKADGNTIIIVSAILGTMIALSIIGLVVWKVFKAKRAVKRAIDGGAFGVEEGPPTGAIEVSGKTDYDEDNASVLSVEDLSVEDN